MHSLDHSASEFQQKGPLCFDDALPGENAIPPKGNLEIADIIKIAEAKLFLPLCQERFRYNRELSYAF